MSIFTHFTELLNSASPVTPQGLQLAEQQVEGVIDVIDTELALLDPAKFEADGHIPDGSFGGSDRAPALAMHHRRAHQVTVDTLHGVRTDLVAFRTACQEARAAIHEADLNAADELRLKQAAVTSLTTGSFSDHGADAYTNAQHEHDAPTGGEG